MAWMRKRISGGSLLFDGIVLSALGIWFAGGVNFAGHLYLKHGADPRRAAFIVAILGYLFFKKLRSQSLVLRAALSIGKRLQSPQLRWGFFALGVGVAVQIAVLQALALRFPLWDVGIFHQILWSLSHGLGFSSTVSGAGNFLTDHMAPSLILLWPGFWLSGESPLYLPVVQVLLVFGGGAAWIFLAERLDGERSSSLAAATTVFVFSFDSLWKNLSWGFHENAIAFFALSWAFALLFSLDELSQRASWKKSLIFILFLIAAGAKEIVLLDVALGFLVWAGMDLWRPEKARSIEPSSTLTSREGWVWGLVGSKVLLALILLSSFVAFERMGHPEGKNYFNRYYAYLGAGLPEFLRNLVLSPGRVLDTIGGKALSRYLFSILLPWLFLIPVVCIFKRKAKSGIGSIQFSSVPQAVWLVMILPSLASAALASYAPLRNLGFHYVLELWPAFAGVTLVGLARQKSEAWAWSWALLSLLALDYDPVSAYREYRVQALDQARVRELIQKIPVDVSIIADELAGPWVAGRRWVTRWPDLWLFPRRQTGKFEQNNCPEYLLLQDTNEHSTSQIRQVLDQCRPPEDPSLKGLEEVWKAGHWVFYRFE